MRTYAGLDYTGPGSQVNRDPETGIRYGIIHTNRVCPHALEDIYSAGTDIDYENYQQAIKDALAGALKEFGLEKYAEDAYDGMSDAIGDNYPGNNGDCTRYEYKEDGYELMIDGSGDLWVMKSPFFTYAQFCSPCAPGACYLTNALEGQPAGNKCYCLGTDWFDEEEKCPYPIYSMETGEQI